MGFFSSLKESYSGNYKEESDRLDRRDRYSGYKTVLQKESEKIEYFSSLDDGGLLAKLNSAWTSDGDKKYIVRELQSRGYSRNANGGYSKR